MSSEIKGESTETSIFLDEKVITEEIEKNKIYQTEEIKIRKWEGEESTNNYLAEIDKAGTKYIGVLDSLFERDGYGMYTFENGEKYFGFFKEDKRNFNGIYIWPGEAQEGRTKIESYYGFWKDNKKNKNGMYIWLDEPTGNDSFDNANFDAYVGKFEESTYDKGTFLRKYGDDYFLYHGSFTKNGLKNDDNAFFYSAKYDRLFHGKIANDVFIYGYVSFFDSDSGELSNMVYCTFNEDKSVASIRMNDELTPEELENEKQINLLFRNVILGIDYFGEIYKKYKDMIQFMDENMNSMDVFDDKEKFPTMIKLAVSYYNNNVYSDIELKVFGNKD